MKKKSAKLKRLKILDETVRLKRSNEALESYLKLQTLQIHALSQQYANESRQLQELKDAAKVLGMTDEELENLGQPEGQTDEAKLDPAQ